MTQPSQGVVFRPLQSRFLDIPQATLSYSTVETLARLFTSFVSIDNLVNVRRGLSTGQNDRLMRCYWEVPIQSNRWSQFVKAGRYCRWSGLHSFAVDWPRGRVVMENLSGARIQNEKYYALPGATFSQAARGSLGVRILFAEEAFEAKSPSIFARSDDFFPAMMALLNCRATSWLVRAMSPAIDINEASVAALPWPSPIESHVTCLRNLVDLSVALKRILISEDFCERSYNKIENTSVSPQLLSTFTFAAALLSVEGHIESIVFSAYGFAPDEVATVLEETGSPAAWFPLVQGYDTLPDLLTSLQGLNLGSALPELLGEDKRLDIDTSNFTALKNRLKLLFESGPKARKEAEDAESAESTDEDEEQITAGARIPIPTETFIEELSQKLEIHPISVYWMLKEGIENEGWRCLPEERRITADRITVLILRLLGHLWPKQVEAGEPIPEWADSEGIIPLTEGAAKPPLLDTLRKRLPSELGAPAASAFERDFPGVMGKSFDQWIETEFFKHHAKQFKKRPIAWKIQSGPFSKKRKPAFACLVYYHRLNADTFPKLRTHYVGPLRQRFETELHGIEAVPLDARSDRQEKRRVLLENQIQELKDFDSRLERIANEGFGPRGLRPALRQAAIDDAMLHLKAAWLDRLQDTIAKGPLPEWVYLARETALECPIEDWIVEAFSHIAHHCSRLGPGSPEQGKMSRDPEASDLAELICTHSSEMIKGALSLGCNEWWQKVDNRLFRPFREKIQKLRDEIKRLNDEANQSGSSLPTKAKKTRDLDRQIKDIKAQIKQLKNQLDDLVSRATQVREAIEGWECPEVETWEPWLGGQPLYDAISTLDGKQRPLGTVEEFVRQESIYAPDINDGVRINVAPIQKAGLLLSDVLSSKDIDKAISDRIHWRSDERRWCREGRLPQPGWLQDFEGTFRGVHKGGATDAPSG